LAVSKFELQAKFLIAQLELQCQVRMLSTSAQVPQCT